MGSFVILANEAREKLYYEPLACQLTRHADSINLVIIHNLQETLN